MGRMKEVDQAVTDICQQLHESISELTPSQKVAVLNALRDEVASRYADATEEALEERETANG